MPHPICQDPPLPTLGCMKTLSLQFPRPSLDICMDLLVVIFLFLSKHWVLSKDRRMGGLGWGPFTKLLCFVSTRMLVLKVTLGVVEVRDCMVI